jgi:hypothetical protein
VSTVARRRAVVGLAALLSFIIAGALRSFEDASPYIVVVFIVIGVVLGLSVAASIVRARG